jgi:hypothetical protein
MSVALSPEIPFGEWLPDIGDYKGGLSDAKNCVGFESYYGSIKSLVESSDALPDKSLGAFSMRASDGTVHSFAGTAEKLYKLNGTSWTDVTWSTSDYTTGADGYWLFTNFGDLVIATNYNDDIQVFDVLNDTEFDQLSATAPRARYIFVLNNFLVCLDTFDGDGALGNRVRWSPLGQPAGDWTPDIDTQAGFNDLFGGGYKNAAGVGTDSYGTIIQDSAIWRMQYVGGDQIFTFDLQVQDRGTIYPRTVSTNGIVTYYLDIDGFCAFDGTSVFNIGENKVNRWFFERLNSSYGYNMSAAIDPINKLYAVSFPTVQSGSPDSTLIMLYNYKSGKFTYIEQSSSVIFGFLTSGYTLETLSAAYPNIETVPYSLDSTFWQGGDFNFGAISANGKLSSFNGDVYEAVIATPETRINQNGKAVITALQPIVEQGTVTARLGYREKLTDTVSYTAERGQNTITGEIEIMQSARYIRAEFTLTDWDLAKGYAYRSKAGGVV